MLKILIVGLLVILMSPFFFAGFLARMITAGLGFGYHMGGAVFDYEANRHKIDKQVRAQSLREGGVEINIAEFLKAASEAEAKEQAEDKKGDA